MARQLGLEELEIITPGANILLIPRVLNMNVMELVTDHWQGTQQQEHTLQNPSFSDIHTAIKKLDGQRYTIVVLNSKEETQMVIGGGANGQYVVYVAHGNEDFFNLVSSDEANETISLIVGGQEGNYPSNTLVTVGFALKAARTFAERGELEPSFKWRR